MHKEPDRPAVTYADDTDLYVTAISEQALTHALSDALRDVYKAG